MLLDIIGGSRVFTQANLGEEDGRLKIQWLFFQLCARKNFDGIVLTVSRKDPNGIFRPFSTALLMSAPQPRFVGFPGICNGKRFLPEDKHYSYLLLQAIELLTIAR